MFLTTDPSVQHRQSILYDKGPLFQIYKELLISILILINININNKNYLKDVDAPPKVSEVGALPVGVRQADFQHLTELENCNSNNKEPSLTTMMAKVRKTDNT